MSVAAITSNTLIPIEEHFRVSAGPGAGKTHWLINHIRNVLQHSDRMGTVKKIACITYTNIAVETIVKRFDFITDRVEVSTIHGFLYSNIIKPYMGFIADEFEFNLKRMDGHDDHFVSRKKIKEWLETHPNKNSLKNPYTLNQLTLRPNNMEALDNWVGSLSCTLNGTNVEITFKNAKAYYGSGSERGMLSAAKCLNILSSHVLDYKKLFWKDGILHHDDVLYFTYILLQRYPFILTVLRSKFPYFYIDEFQDTSPIQAAILGMIGESETIVGVIGDESQSIYSFQGANPAYFTGFSLPSIKDYLIRDNRRSSNEIINLLNHIRTDIKQSPIRNESGEKIIYYVGDLNQTVAAARENAENLIVLSRDNITSNALKRQMNSTMPAVDLISELTGFDNSERRRAVIRCLTALELVYQQKFKDAVKEMEKNFYAIQDKHVRKKTALKKICVLISAYPTFKALPLLSFYELVRTEINAGLSKITKGKPKDFYDTYTYEQLAVCIKMKEDDSPSRTIHKAKGDEFNDVLVVLTEPEQLRFLTNPPITIEEQRVFYVAVSRARNRLFITSPELSEESENKINSLVDVIRIV